MSIFDTIFGGNNAGSGAAEATGPTNYAATTRAVDNGPNTIPSTSGPGNPNQFSDKAKKSIGQGVSNAFASAAQRISSLAAPVYGTETPPTTEIQPDNVMQVQPSHFDIIFGQ